MSGKWTPARESGELREKTASDGLGWAPREMRARSFKADGNSRLKTPLSSRELNSNVHHRGAADAKDAERRRDVCAFLSRLVTLMAT